MPLSYNDQSYRTSELRHLFVPSGYNLVAESVVAVVALIILNLSLLSHALGGAGDSINTSPFTLWSRVLDKLLSPSQHAGVQQIMLIVLWGVVGALIYIMVFRLIQVFLRARGSLQQGVSLVQAEHSQGAMRYLASLHDLFVKLIIGLLGTLAILTGSLLCFAIASQELSLGLDDSFPAGAGNIAIALAGALIGVRVGVIGLSLLSSRFRNWYNA